MKQVGRFSKWMACAAALGAFVMVSSAEAKVGVAVVRRVQGSADFSQGSATWSPLTKGKQLKPGAIIRTGAGSEVDLFLDRNGPVVRVTENTQLGIDRLSYEKSSVETVIDTGLDLKAGRILGLVDKMAEASKYEVKTPHGVAGIRGTEYDISAFGKVTVVSGSVVFVHAVDGKVNTYVINTGETFNPDTQKVTPTDPNELADLVPIFNDFASYRQPPIPVTIPRFQPPISPQDIAEDSVDSYRQGQSSDTAESSQGKSKP